MCVGAPPHGRATRTHTHAHTRAHPPHTVGGCGSAVLVPRGATPPTPTSHTHLPPHLPHADLQAAVAAAATKADLQAAVAAALTAALPSALTAALQAAPPSVANNLQPRPRASRKVGSKQP